MAASQHRIYQSMHVAGGEVVEYNLHVQDTVVDFTGKSRRALATNGQIPAPTLKFTEGDTALIHVHNNTNTSISFHWHGIILPNKEDGVPMLTTEVIEPGDLHTFRFPIVQFGTYWYHSHTMFQEQKGLFGPIVIQPYGAKEKDEKVVMLSDWTDQKAEHVQRQLKRHTEWYAIKRNAVQSYGQAIATGNLGAKAWLEWKRMPEVDLADVYYNAFLTNGKLQDNYIPQGKTETVKLRVINGSSSSHFWLQYAGGKMKIVAADGVDVVPVEVDKLLIATAETYDIEVEVDAGKSYEFRATSWDRYKYTSLWLGDGERVAAEDMQPVDYFGLINEMKGMMAGMKGMKMGKVSMVPATKLYGHDAAPTYQSEEMKMGMGHMHHMHGMKKENSMPGQNDNHDHRNMKMDMEHGNHTKADEDTGMKMNMGGMDKGTPFSVMMTGYKQVKGHNSGEVIFDYNMLEAKSMTTLPAENPVRVIHLYLTGNMFRYVWTMNNKPLSRADKIAIKQGENVRFVMHNTTMMSHPMHLHGHFFRVINKHGDKSPLKHTVNIAPMENLTMEFEATEDKDWFFHCHLLYHMMSGMARVINYDNTVPALTTERGYKKFAKEDRRFYTQASAMVQSNGAFTDFSFFNIYNELSIEADADYFGAYNAEGKLMRYIDPKQFFVVYAGAEAERYKVFRAADREFTYDNEAIGVLGVRYFLPMHFWSDLRIDHNGIVQVEIEREDIPITARWHIGGGTEYNFAEGWEYRINTSYRLLRNLAVSANYDSDYGVGAGLQFIY